MAQHITKTHFLFIWSPVCGCKMVSQVKCHPVENSDICAEANMWIVKCSMVYTLHALMFPADQHVLKWWPTHVWSGSHGQLAGRRPPGGRVRNGLQSVSAWTHISARLCCVHPFLPYNGKQLCIWSFTEHGFLKSFVSQSCCSSHFYRCSAPDSQPTSGGRELLLLTSVSKKWTRSWITSSSSRCVLGWRLFPRFCEVRAYCISFCSTFSSVVGLTPRF